MGVQKSLDLLHPVLAKRVRYFLRVCEDRNIDIGVLETLRSQEVQNAYYAQGREPLEKVNVLRKSAGLYLLSESENKRTVTNTLKSRHFTGRAIDMCPMKNGRFWWAAPEQVWQEIGLLAEECGLDWCAGGYGQTWGKGWDNPHFELPEDIK